MTVKELIEKLQEFPEHLHVYAEGNPADLAIMEYYKGVPQLVRIFKRWDVEFIDSPISRLEENDG